MRTRKRHGVKRWGKKVLGKLTFKCVAAGIFAAMVLVIVGCGPDPYYVRVEFIEGVPDTGTAGTPLTLTATIRPSFASNNDIVWSVKDPGTTRASISGNILNARATGTVIIRALIANGFAEGKEYTQDFTVVFTGAKFITDITVEDFDAAAKIGETEYPTLNKAIEAASGGTADDPTEITILKNITTDSDGEPAAGYTIPGDKHIKLTVESGKSITINASAGEFALFTVSAGSSLTLGPLPQGGTLTLDGKNLNSANRRVVRVDGGTLNMNSGVTIKDYKNDTGDVFVANNGSLGGRIVLSGDAR